ncbi:retinoid-inducible serine carboxypeptidase-like [Battus philenor]|uniref:retinoid-inducible serine carboxypeptidase-like n=1 Tax=Battus philenor TaxID=42288 RepID=UPI0035D10AAA
MTKITSTIIKTAAILLIAVGLIESEAFETIKLEGKGFDGIDHTAAFTRISGVGDIFWLFWPTLASDPTTRPLILWLDGVTGVSPSLRTNFEYAGPIDTDITRVEESWSNYFNLLLVDSPVGTGYSRAENAANISKNFDDHVDNLVNVVQSFYELHKEYANTPLHIFGQAHGAQLAVALGIRLAELKTLSVNIKSVALGNGMISPDLPLTQIGFYLEELGIIDAEGRAAIEEYTRNLNKLVADGRYEEAFDAYMSLSQFINEEGHAFAIDLTDIGQKVPREVRDFFGGEKISAENFKLMEETVPPLIGLSSDVKYDEQREAAIKAFRNSLMKPSVDKVEYLLQNTNVTVAIYNGNKDAILNTQGQLMWVQNLKWSGQENFLNTPRETLVRDGAVMGYFRKTPKLQFYWLSNVGQMVLYYAYGAITRVAQIITNTPY